MGVNVGDIVTINPQSDRTRKLLVDGVVEEVLTRNVDHPHGVKVVLQSGEIGRVKKSNATEIPVRDREKAPVVNVGIAELITQGESQDLEFKTSAMWSNFYTKEKIDESKSYDLKIHGQKASSFVLAKSIAGFANADGGHLIIGVKEDKESEDLIIVGIETELFKLKDKNIDGYRRMIVDDVISRFLPKFFLHHLSDYIDIAFPQLSDEKICVLKVEKADKPIFVKLKKEQFFVRIDASTRELSGEDVLNYCKRRFVS